MRLGYNTNGTICHRWDQAIELMADIGYQSVALTVDHGMLNPYSSDLPAEIRKVRQLLDRLKMNSVIETGARFLLNPRRKHEPTFLSRTAEDRATRIDFLTRCVQIAHELNSEAVSFWSGTGGNDVDVDDGYRLVAEGCRRVLDVAEPLNVRLAFEPEPGMLIQTLDDYRKLLSLVDGPGFGLTVDIGHLHCLDEVPIADRLIEWHERLFTIHIEDMQRGIHDHLRFGEGTIDFPPILNALKAVRYSGSVNVELSRHSHMAPQVMQESFDFLSKFILPG